MFFKVKEKYMKNKNNFLVLGFCFIVVITTIISTACSSPPVSSKSVTPSETVATTTTQVSSPVTSQPPFEQRPATNGTIADVNGNMVTLTTSQGQMTVKVSSDTPIEETVTGTFSDLAPGVFVTINGSTDGSGNISATTINIGQQRQGGQFSPPTGTSFGNGGDLNRTTSPNSSLPSNYDRQITAGNITQVNGDSFTITTVQGQQSSVNVSATTIIRKTVSGSLVNLTDGESLTVFGSEDSNGIITATSIIVRNPGQGFPPNTQNQS